MFLSDLEVKKVGEDKWMLLSPLEYASPYLDRIIVVPAGFIHDFASVPRAPFAFMLFGDTAHKAAVVHDWLYTTHCHPDAQVNEPYINTGKKGEYVAGSCDISISRKDADAVFMEAVTSEESGWRAKMMWLGVRLGGGRSWKK